MVLWSRQGSEALRDIHTDLCVMNVSGYELFLTNIYQDFLCNNATEIVL